LVLLYYFTYIDDARSNKNQLFTAVYDRMCTILKYKNQQQLPYAVKISVSRS